MIIHVEALCKLAHATYTMKLAHLKTAVSQLLIPPPSCDYNYVPTCPQVVENL